MKGTDVIRLRHMLEAAREALSFVAGHNREDLNKDKFLMHVLVREIEIIGEAASKVSKETLEQLTNLPWRAIIGMRNRLIHGYNNINLDILWGTVQYNLPVIITELEKLPDLQ